jgi:SulP family sulfate permease
LSADCIRLIRRAEKICDVNVLEDPGYYVAVDS